MIRAIAVDDDLMALKVITNFCSEMDFIKIEKTFSDPTEALAYLKNFPVDLVFLDIDMPQINGLELSKKIQQDTMVIFTTTHTEYAIDGFNLNAVDYIGKPYTFQRFQQALNKAKTFFSLKHQQESSGQIKYLFFRADFMLHKINMADIIYIEGLDDYLKIHVGGAKPLVVRMTMKEMISKLPVKEFSRVHRSFIVSVNKIEKVKGKSLVVADKEIKIGQSYEEEVLKLFSQKNI